MNIRISSTTGTNPVLYLPEDMYSDFNASSVAKLTVNGMKLTVDCGKTLEERIKLAVKTRRDLRSLYGNVFTFMSSRGAGVTVCAVSEKHIFGVSNGRTRVGIAVCAPGDPWNNIIGEAIAMCRAVDIPVPLALVSF